MAVRRSAQQSSMIPSAVGQHRPFSPTHAVVAEHKAASGTKARGGRSSASAMSLVPLARRSRLSLPLLISLSRALSPSLPTPSFPSSF
eukprot:scaffold294741_cov37-Tisochrysis_lutea.AAC.4